MKKLVGMVDKKLVVPTPFELTRVIIKLVSWKVDIYYYFKPKFE